MMIMTLEILRTVSNIQHSQVYKQTTKYYYITKYLQTIKS